MTDIIKRLERLELNVPDTYQWIDYKGEKCTGYLFDLINKVLDHSVARSSDKSLPPKYIKHFDASQGGNFSLALALDNGEDFDFDDLMPE